MPKPLRQIFTTLFPTWFVPFVFLLSPGCDEGENHEDENSSTKVYVSRSYGYAVSFNEETDEAVGFAVQDGSCWAQPIPSEIWWAAPRDNQSMDFDYLGQKQPGMPFTRVKNLEKACPEGLLSTVLDDDFTPDLRQEFELFHKTFSDQYAFFELRGLDWDQQVQAAEKKITEEMSVEEFFEVLSAMVAPLGDGHIVIQAGDELVFNASAHPDIYTTLSQEAATQVDLDSEEADALVDEYVTDELSKIQSAVERLMVEDTRHGDFNDPMFWAQLESEGSKFGYLRLTSFSELVPSGDFPVVRDNINALHALMDEVLEQDNSEQGLVIDVRINDGGWDQIGRELLSRFIEKETHVYSKRVYADQAWGEKIELTVTPHDGEPYTKPIVVLAGPSTISAAETFVMAMRELTQVRVVGEPTNGITSDSTPKFLPSGIYFSFSNEEYSSPEGDVFEAIGVPPDIEATVFSQQDRSQGTDSALLRALSDLNDRSAK